MPDYDFIHLKTTTKYKYFKNIFVPNLDKYLGVKDINGTNGFCLDCAGIRFLSLPRTTVPRFHSPTGYRYF